MAIFCLWIDNRNGIYAQYGLVPDKPPSKKALQQVEEGHFIGSLFIGLLLYSSGRELLEPIIILMMKEQGEKRDKQGIFFLLVGTASCVATKGYIDFFIGLFLFKMFYCNVFERQVLH